MLYWIVPTFKAAGFSIFFGSFACLALSLYLGIYWGIFCFIGKIFLERFNAALSILFCAALWVALEYLRTHLFTGFPWGVLGYSQWEVPYLIQISEWTGVYGVSFLVILFNLNLLFVLKKKFVLISWGLFFLLIGTNFFLYPKESEKTKVMKTITILQGNIDQYKKWSDVYVQEILSTYGALVKENSIGSDLILWPEATLPGWFPNEPFLEGWIQNIIKKTKTPHLVGAVTEINKNAYNSAFLFSPEGAVLDRYDKLHLIPFGEFVPFEPIFKKVAPLISVLGNFSRGKENRNLEISDLKIGVTICYEAIFPNLVRKQVKEGANLLVNISNDGWYLDTAAPLQHFSMNVFRAVENRRYLVRAANTGISGVILTSGKIGVRTRINERKVLQVQVLPQEEKTFYFQFGDIFALICSLITIIALFFVLFRKKYENA